MASMTHMFRILMALKHPPTYAAHVLPLPHLGRHNSIISLLLLRNHNEFAP